MSNLYLPVSARAKALHGEKPFEADLSAAEEADQLAGAHLEIVPRAYKVLSNNFAAGKQGSTVELALQVENEAALIEGGHIERAESATSTTKKG
jgi:hypothetical protein